MQRVIDLCVGAILFASLTLLAQNRTARSWKFAVSGDSRNCGDIVMPAIAAGVHKSGAVFYWHLGDFRAIYTFDDPVRGIGAVVRILSSAGLSGIAGFEFPRPEQLFLLCGFEPHAAKITGSDQN